MGLFHVWLKFCVQKRRTYQRLITFVNREAADEWWRTISTPPSVHVGRVERMSPQLYVQIDGSDVWYSFDNSTSPDTRHFSVRMLSSSWVESERQDNTVTVLPTVDIADHISGRWFFIRSKADPFSYWYLRTSGTCAVCSGNSCNAIHVSSDSRTRFCVRVRNKAEVPDNFVMIGTDEISIVAPKGYVVYVNDAGDLKAMQGCQCETDLLFGDLKNRFVARTERQVNGELWEYIESVERGIGEIWELVE